jgi:hypothetical protein
VTAEGKLEVACRVAGSKDKLNQLSWQRENHFLKSIRLRMKSVGFLWEWKKKKERKKEKVQDVYRVD